MWRKSVEYQQLENELIESIRKADDARRRFDQNEIPGMAEGLFHKMSSAIARVGDAVMTLLDEGHYLCSIDLYSTNQPCTLKGDHSRQAYIMNVIEENQETP